MKKLYGFFACDEGVVDWEKFETEAEAAAYVKGIERVLDEAEAGDGEIARDFYRGIVSDREPISED